jgi:hypothetical protein
VIHRYHSIPAPIEDVIGDNLENVILDYDDPMEVVQDEESREPETVPPEWMRNPGIQVVVIPGRGIIGDCRRPLVVIVVVDDRGVGVLAVVSFRFFRRIFRVRGGNHGQTRLGGKVLKREESVFLIH